MTFGLPDALIFNMHAVDPEKVFWRNVEGEVVLLNVETGFYYTLEGAGCLIWDMAVKNLTPEQMAIRVAEKFDVETPRALKDIRELLGALEKEELIRTFKSPGGENRR